MASISTFGTSELEQLLKPYGLGAADLPMLIVLFIALLALALAWLALSRCMKIKNEPHSTARIHEALNDLKLRFNHFETKVEQVQTELQDQSKTTKAKLKKLADRHLEYRDLLEELNKLVKKKR